MEQATSGFTHPSGESNKGAVIPGPVLVDGEQTIRLPLRYSGGDLGLGNGGEPWIYFRDATGDKFLTHSVEWLLKNIEHFAEGRDRDQPLACAAIHYGLDVCALLGRDQLCDVRTVSGDVLLGSVPHEVACWAYDQYMSRPEWSSDIHIRFLHHFVRPPFDNRHEGPLELLQHSLGVTNCIGVAVKSHIGRCGLTLEEALRRIEQFSHAHQAELMKGVAKHLI